MKNKILFAILALGLMLRILGLSSHPAGFTPDEASFGYDAYSILKTGHDQWGNFLPITLKSFGDYKLPFYTYLAVPSVAVFGLNEFAVRLPNALIGSLAVLATYLLAKEVFGKKPALLATFLLAVSPWQLPMSRGAFEANLTTLFMPLGIYFFIKGLKDSKLMFLSALFFGINVFTYHSARFVTPAVVLVLLAANWKHLYEKRMRYLLPALVIAIFGIVAAYSFLVGGEARAATSTIFSRADTILSDRFGAIHAGEPLLIAKIFNNKFSYLLQLAFGKYIGYFSLGFLFTNGAAEGTYGMLPGVGVLYLFEILGFSYLFVSLVKKKAKIPLWLLLWVLVAPVPAALTTGLGFAANRSEVVLPAVQIISGLGLWLFYKYLIKKFDIKYVQIAVTVVVMLSVSIFLEEYFYQQPSKEAPAMIYGMREVMQEVRPIQDQYSTIIVSKRISEPHIYVAFYQLIDPIVYQKASMAWNFEDNDHLWVDQQSKYTLGKYIFKNIDWVNDLKRPNTLIIAKASEYIDKGTIIGRVNYPNGQKAYVLVDTRVNSFASLIN